MVWRRVTTALGESPAILTATPRRRIERSVSMLGWAFNEEASIAGYIDRAEALLRSVTDDFELIVIDDGSHDRTWATATACQESRPWLRLYRNDRNRGPGYSAKRAIAFASKDILFWQTVDWAYDVDEIADRMWQLQEFDVLQGVRPRVSLWQALRGRSDNWRKAVISLVNYRLVRTLFRLPLGDYQNVTVYPRALLQSVTLETESAFTNVECLLKTFWLGARFKEVRVPFIKRVRGTATGTRPRELFAAIRDILRWWVQWIVLGRRQFVRRGTVARLAVTMPAAASADARGAVR
jgi:glycosyltransferase involved in cell wall biosynthesis